MPFVLVAKSLAGIGSFDSAFANDANAPPRMTARKSRSLDSSGEAPPALTMTNDEDVCACAHDDKMEASPRVSAPVIVSG